MGYVKSEPIKLCYNGRISIFSQLLKTTTGIVYKKGFKKADLSH